MKKFLCVMFLFFSACSSANVSSVIEERKDYSEADNIIILVRSSLSSGITHDEYVKNINTWLSGYNTDKNLTIVNSTEKLSVYKDSSERFYQVSAGKEFLKYKSLGVIRMFVSENRDEIQNIMRENRSDYIVIYEIGGAYSPYLKAIKYNSVMAILNRENDVVYLDNQQKYVGSAEFDRDDMKKEFLDSVVQRLYTTLTDLKILQEK